MERLFDKVLVTGGAGYCGARLVPQMLARGYKVTVYDIMFFGNQFLPRDNPNLRIIDGDIRDTAKFAAAVAGHDAVVNLACISNDASFELDEDLSTSINLNAFEPLVLAAKKAGVKRFVYASSSSVYGVSDNPDVTEDHPLVPLTLYNKYKGMCEPLLKKHTDASFTGVIFRPATVCGYSPRQRLDLSVNILTNHAINAGKITVFGGSQLRPNLHIQDYCDAVQLFLTAPADKVQNETFNVGYQNLSLMEIAELVRRVVGEEMPDRKAVDIVTTPTDDVRSYHINSDKIKRVLGYQPQRTIEDAVRELCQAFLARKLPNSMEDDRYYNVRLLKKAEGGMSSGKPVAVVTGGAGFIGSHMVDALLDAGFAVRVIDNLVGGHRSNLDHLKGNPDLACYWQDIRQLEPDSRSLPERDAFSTLPASATSCPRSSSRLQYMDANVQGTVRVLECARQARVDKFVYAASSSCYGLAAVPTAKTILSTRNIRTRSANIRASRRLFTGTGYIGCRSIRSASSMPMVRACARPGSMARSSACSFGRSWPANRIRLLVTGPSAAISST